MYAGKDTERGKQISNANKCDPGESCFWGKCESPDYHRLGEGELHPVNFTRPEDSRFLQGARGKAI